ncbi:Uncharacterized protein HZ326_26703 [Fusarium oxysporum f. sp. albedinis]|nr:Uncharacterized protein HZ326_26703 [Fusarium oxysporum f. sp. albedinis]
MVWRWRSYSSSSSLSGTAHAAGLRGVLSAQIGRGDGVGVLCSYLSSDPPQLGHGSAGLEVVAMGQCQIRFYQLRPALISLFQPGI